jgi:LPXTG-motif cell wall-anchored protein
MRLAGRLTATLAPAMLVFGVVAGTLASSAQALPAVQVVGSAAPAVVHGPGTVVFTYTITVPVAIDSTSFTTHQASALPASVTGATLDGAPVPAAQITQPSSVDISIQTGAAPTDGLAAGIHTITFTASVANGPAVSTSSSATLSWIQASVPASLSAAPVAVAVNQPDIAVNNLVPDVNSPVPVATGTTGFVGTGMFVQLNVDVMNLGFGTPHTTLTITLPTGLELAFAIRDVDAEGGPPLSCLQIGSAPPQFNCPLGSPPHFTDRDDPAIQFVVTTTANPPVGTVGTITVSAAADAGEGTDTNPANNSATTTLKFTGLAALSATITPTATKIQLGGQTTVTVTIHNAGPQPAEQTFAFIEALGSGDKSAVDSGCCAFDITGFTGTTPPPGLAGNGELQPVFPTTGVTWLVGTIAPGSSVRAILTVRAREVGKGQLQLWSVDSTATDPRCPNDTCSAASASLRAVPDQHRTTATARPVAAAPATLPATGQASPALLGLAVGLLITGAALTGAARRRRAL